MTRFILTIAIIVALNFAVFSQTSNEQEDKWERYAFKDQGFSILLPRLPVVNDENYAERSEETRKFGTYLNGVAYVVTYSRELKDNPLKKTQPVEPFSEKNFERRLKAITESFQTFKEQINKSETAENKWKVIQLIGKETIYKLYFDTKSKNWIELSAFSPNDSKTEVENFFASFKFEKKPESKEVGSGATSVIEYVPPTAPGIASGNGISPSVPQNAGGGIGGQIGSGSVDNASSKEANKDTANNKVDSKPLRLILSPRAAYTQEARKSNIQGSVSLRVTFSSSGGVTSVSVIRGLPYGLTESAIAAARKMVFIPGKRNGSRISISKVVEYGFNIY